jgi:hypothetical protein
MWISLAPLTHPVPFLSVFFVSGLCPFCSFWVLPIARRRGERVADEQRYTEQEAHRHFAASLFNHVWSLLEKTERTPAEAEEMLHAAHASRYHWGVVGEPVNLGIGEWQISRVNAVLKRPEAAACHGQRYLELCREHDLGPFHFGFACEALARAAAVAGVPADCARYLELAREHAEQIADEGERTLLLDDLATIRC